uniref:Xaa-Pro dipeptidase n=1 Tax=Onchocerca volvulus TaxID=6282 RepID=A0A8R1Y8L4_ONCVO
MSFTMGNETFTVAAKLFAQNRTRLVEMLRNKVQTGSIILLKGGIEQNRYNTDALDLPFRQESYFFWTFGVHESNCFGAIDIDSGRSFLFLPRLHPDYVIWHGKIYNEDWYQKKYEVDEVHFNDKNTIIETLTNLHAKQLLLLVKFLTFEGVSKFCFSFPCDTSILYPVMAELRVFKTDQELNVMRYVCKVASEAHKAVMKAARPGMYEYQLESLFRHHCYYHGGCRHLAYTCIASSGYNSSILHYGHENAPNSKEIIDGDLCLFDMGPEYNCYASDITTTFPCNGKFTEKQKIIYNAVLAANREVFKTAQPGIQWDEMHKLAEMIILSHLRDAGILKGDLEKMMEARIGAIFMPHGLGHFMGLDVHDCGGYLGDAKPRSTLPGLKALRTTRALQERMVITIEPGCYFIDTLLDAALNDPIQKKFIVKEKLDDFRGFGGVRIEDDIVIWANGNERMSNVPRTVDEIEQFMSERQ